MTQMTFKGGIYKGIKEGEETVVFGESYTIVNDTKLDESYICIITLSGIPCTIESDSLRVLRGGKWIEVNKV